MADKIRELMAWTSPAIFIFYALDEGFFYSSNDAGLSFPARDEAGVVHLTGEAKVIGKDSQYEAFNLLQPLFKAAGGKPMVLITPYLRWTEKTCCSDTTHTTNTGNMMWAEHLATKLDEAARNYRTFFHTKGYKNISVLNPGIIGTEMVPHEIWDTDPTIPGAAFFDKLAASIIVNNTTSKPRPVNTGGPPNKRQRQNPSANARGGGQSDCPESPSTVTGGRHYGQPAGNWPPGPPRGRGGGWRRGWSHFRGH